MFRQGPRVVESTMGDLYKKWSDQTGKVGPITCSILTGIVLAVPISTIVMGAIHLDNCPAERYIPIYLIVSGCFSIVLSLFRVLGAWTQDEEGKATTIQYLSGLISSFLFGWFITGNVWIYRIHNTYNPDNVLAPNYCHHTFYLFAFWITTANYILIGLSCLIGCCVLLLTSCCG